MKETATSGPKPPYTPLILTAWAAMLLASDLPDMLWRLFAPEPSWLSWAKFALLGAFLLVTLASRSLRPLWPFAMMFLTVKLAALPNALAWWTCAFPGRTLSYATGQLAIQLGELLVMVVVLLVLWAIRRDRRAFFLAKGDLAALLEPVRWLGIGPGEKWSTFGWIIGGAMFAGMLTFLALAGALPFGRLSQAAPRLWTILVFPAMNAISEELTLRLPLLATTHHVIGKQNALWLTAVYFGLAHVLHGDPNGLIGFVVIALPVFLLGKSMLETRGSLWAIVMHFLGDIPIFSMYALNAA